MLVVNSFPVGSDPHKEKSLLHLDRLLLMSTTECTPWRRVWMEELHCCLSFWLLAWDHATPQGLLVRGHCHPTTTTTRKLGMKSVSVRSARLTGGSIQQIPTRPRILLRKGRLWGRQRGRRKDRQRDRRLDAAAVGVSLAVS